MAEIRVPKLNTNDSAYVLLEWLVADGAPVRGDDVVASVETSKTVEELVSGHDGILVHLVPAGADCTPGQPIARITSHPAPVAAGSGDALPSTAPLITAPAQALIDELGIDPARVRALTVKVVRRADVERLAAVPPAAVAPSIVPAPAPSAAAASPGAAPDSGVPAGESVQRLSGNQRAVGRTVSLSHQTIPAAYTAIKVDVGKATAAARDLTKRLRKLVGLPDLLIAAVARLHQDFPLCFATLLDEDTAAVPDAPDVGVTIDLGTGLYVPVIRDARNKGIEEIAGELAGFRRLAQRGGFRQEHLDGGNIVVTLHHDRDIVMAVPIVFPGQACALALTSPQREGERTVAVIGLAYDHRLVNGRDAVLFLQALKEGLEAASFEGL
ncbi:2-oxo acid dehydrogenase subunit E2 [Nonomuraea angiospora]|uniref:2-oxo acid dehydrogenase subunit E2 n=1 Tax=Nonomuraea angiospora TaxID=46172 RepID=UPI0029AED8FA|nr:2-oxo acid dehydrogenase subunit E2 [Nonomuraea angiospora]MDX3107835.1 2-oxo acid dehydrogenase subunit E2 [Nonomuraea angiospora]